MFIKISRSEELNYLQQFSWPNVNLVPEVELYGRTNEFAKISLNANGVNFQSNGSLLTDTFFNSLSVGVWKKHTDISNLQFIVEGNGNFLIQFGLHRLGHAHRWLHETEVALEHQERIIDLPFWECLEDGMLYFKIIALSDGFITNGGYVTSEKPIHDVKLGIVITHFNRKQYVVPAMKRIQEQLIFDNRFTNNIDLIVVDNSQNITSDESHGATIIPNLNLGGSGGFTRGLLHLKDNATYTHCLFMDDDASCEIESIRRAYVFLQYTKVEKTAVAGSLLREVEPYRLFEKGGYFSKVGQPIKSGFDMRSINDLLLADHNDTKPNYGAWWFFAFKISDVNHYAFPFFVRGDDILFSLLNKFSIVTNNGITCWGEDFSVKDGPIPRYLDTRQIILQRLRQEKISSLSTVLFVCKLFSSALFSYNYASAKAVTFGLNHVMIGPKFWTENMDMSKIRPLIGSFTPAEKMEKVDLANISAIRADYDESALKKIIRIITLNGFLLPSFCIKDDIVYQEKSFRAWFRALFLHKKVLYYYEPSGLGYIAEHNKKLFFKELFSFGWQSMRFIFKYNKLKKEYQEALPYLTSEEFWREVYKGELK